MLAVHAFRRSNVNPQHPTEKRELDTIRQISRRAPRPSREAELDAFRAWAGRPNPVSVCEETVLFVDLLTLYRLS